MRTVYVAGVGSTIFGRLSGSATSLGVRAAKDALTESGVDRRQIGALYLGNFVSGPLTGQEVLAGLVADQLGLAQIPCTKVEGACASGGIAFRHAYLSVAMGLCDAALAVGCEKMTHADTAGVTGALNCAMDNGSDGPSGLTFPGFFGLVSRVYGDRYGVGRRELSAVVRKNKRNGLANPLAQMGADLAEETIDQSSFICDPLQLYDCCPVSDGAAAAVLVSDRFKNDLRQPLIKVLASVQTRGSPRIAGHLDLCTFEATVSAAAQAFEIAGISAGDIHFVELHDCFSIAEIVDSEDLGVVPRGQGAGWAAEGRTGVDGDIPINPSGGLLAKGHPVGATGLGQVYESVLQLRGTHSNQVRGAAIGMTHNLGGAGVACAVNLLGRADA
jgi:acetyl-CoA C-acetyltransferase